MWVEWNPSPIGARVGDCAVRAIAKALGIDWNSAFLWLCVYAFMNCDMPSSDAIWGAVLKANGFERQIIPNSCPDCYTVADFAADNPHGVYVLALGGHVVTVEDGNIYDSWDSSNEVPQYFYFRKDD